MCDVRGFWFVVPGSMCLCDGCFFAKSRAWLCIFLLMGSCHHCEEVIKEADNRVQYLKEGMLPNGVQYLIQQEPGTSLALASLWVRTNLRSRKQLDTAHILEHLMLRKLRRYEWPCLFHAETGVSWMYFRCVSLPQRLPFILKALNELTGFPQTDEEELACTLKEIEHELHRSFDRQPFGTQIADLLEFHCRHFVADCLAIVVISPLDPLNVADQIEILFRNTDHWDGPPIQYVERHDPISDLDAELMAPATAGSLFAIHGPAPALGELPYFQMYPLYIKRLLAKEKKGCGLWECGWQIRGGQSLIFFKCQDRDAAEDFLRAYRATLASPPGTEVFCDMLREALRAYYLAHDGNLTKNFLLGKAALEGYVKDVLAYPHLINEADAEDFFRWWKFYQAVSSLYQWSDTFMPFKRGRFVPMRPEHTSKDFSAYPVSPLVGQRLYLSLSETTLAALVSVPHQKNATVAIFLPKKPPQALDYRYVEEALKQAVHCFQGQRASEDNPDYYLTSAMVFKEDFPEFLKRFCHDLASVQPPPLIKPDLKTGAWNHLCEMIRRGQGAESPLPAKTVMVLSGDFPHTFLKEQADALDGAMQALPVLKALPLFMPDISENAEQVYVMAAISTPSRVESFGFEMLAQLLAQALQERLVLPGLAYRTGAHYRPMLDHGILGVWVETTAEHSQQIQQSLQDLISDLAVSPLSHSQWESLCERTAIDLLLQRDSILKRDYCHCRDLGTRSFEHGCPPREQFLQLKEKYFDLNSWHFIISLQEGGKTEHKRWYIQH